MSAPAFTPGPWAIFDTHPSKSCFYIDRHDQPGEHAIGDVAVIYTTTDETKRANARLIAAAPDLYAALERCIAMFGEIRGDWTDPREECREGMAIARAALAKAVSP